MTSVELLSPARNLQQGIAAINAGADAIYIGANRFGARSAAANRLEDIKQLIEYAHVFGVKVYATLNTILYEDELNEAARLAQQLYEIGTDALIIQDMAFTMMKMPPIPLFASTQTHNYTPDKVLFLEQAGFKRIILARELSLDQIIEIRDKTTVELECFIHGALCVSYSGQCYLGQALKKRSGNRGECAQPCRLKYDLVDAQGKFLAQNKHLLSLRDLNLSAYLQRLLDAGVTSFKIEGRLKDSAYVQNITAYYRRLLDQCIANNSEKFKRASNGNTPLTFEPDPEKTFNRGYTSYNIDGQRETLSAQNSSKSIGKKVACIKQIRNDSLIIESTEIINNGDGLCFYNDRDELQGFRVNIAKANEIIPNEMPDITIGTELYRNHDEAFVRLVQNEICTRKLNISLIFEENNNGLTLCASDELHHTACVELQVAHEPVRNVSGYFENLEKQLCKSGDTVFNISHIDITLAKPWFLPISKINQLRRDTLSALHNKILQNYSREEKPIKPNTHAYPGATIDYRGNVSNSLAELFYKQHQTTVSEPAYELQQNKTEHVLMTTKYCLQYELGYCAKHSPNRQIQAKLSFPLYLVYQDKKFRLSFDCQRCEMSLHG